MFVRFQTRRDDLDVFDLVTLSDKPVPNYVHVPQKGVSVLLA